MSIHSEAATPATNASGFRLPKSAGAHEGQSQTFRKYPAAGIALVVVVIAVAINMLVSQFTKVDYTEIGDSAENLLKGIGASTGAMVVFLIAAVTWLRWWPPIWRQVPRAASRWIWVVPLAMLVTLVLRYLSTLGTERTVTYLVTLVAMAMLVGLGEELAFRGVLLVGLRERFGEGWVARMITGTLLVPIVLHGMWDVSAISLVTADTPNTGLAALSNLVQWLMIISAFVAVWVIARQARATNPDQALLDSNSSAVG